MGPVAGERRQRVFFLGSLYWLASRAAVFFFIISLLILALYLLGNFQGFLDSTQLLLLLLLRLGLLAQILTALAYILVVFLLGRQRRSFGRLILSLLSLAFSAALLLAFSFLSTWFEV